MGILILSDTCAHFHKIVSSCRHINFPFEPSDICSNGIYILFEKGEFGHTGYRIVRIGTHKRTSGLFERLLDHFLEPNKDRSIFRKNIGRALLNKEKDPFLDQWEFDLTSKQNQIRYAHLVDKTKLLEVEEAVTKRIQGDFFFVVLNIDSVDQRLFFEKHGIATVAQCSECFPSPNWLGRYSTKPKILSSGLWQEQHINSSPFLPQNLEELSSYYW